MASLKRRLQQLGTHADMVWQEDAKAIGRDVLRRLTDEELERYDLALKRALEKGFAEEDRPILEGIERLCEEVANEEPTSAS